MVVPEAPRVNLPQKFGRASCSVPSLSLGFGPPQTVATRPAGRGTMDRVRVPVWLRFTKGRRSSPDMAIPSEWRYRVFRTGHAF